MTDEEVIAHLAGGMVLRTDASQSGASLQAWRGSINSDQWNRLGREGWLEGFPNGCGAKLSEAGLLAYLRSTDEMGDGKMVSPAAAKEPKP